MTNHPNPNSAAQAATNNTAQHVLTDDEIRAIQGDHLVTIRSREALIASVIVAGRAIETAVLSKLRSPASDERANAIWKLLDDLQNRAKEAKRYDDFDDLSVLGLMIHKASAPVAGEALDTLTITLEWDDGKSDEIEVHGTEKMLRRLQVWLDRKRGMFHEAAPQASAEPARIIFPSHLRNMWSGGEVQAWLNQHQGVTPPQATAKGSLARYRQWKAEQEQATASCTCPSGDGSLRHPCPTHPGADKDCAVDESPILQGSSVDRSADLQVRGPDVVLPPPAVVDPGRFGAMYTDDQVRAAVLADRQQRAGDVDADRLLAAAKGMTRLYSYVWDRADGCLVVFPENVRAFDAAFGALRMATGEAVDDATQAEQGERDAQD